MKRPWSYKPPLPKKKVFLVRFLIRLKGQDVLTLHVEQTRVAVSGTG